MQNTNDQSIRNLNGTFKPRKIFFKPTRELGYFCGLIIGDGNIYARHGNYKTSIESTQKNIIMQFKKSARKLGLNPSKIYTRMKQRKFPNGTSSTDMCYMSLVSSKVFYDIIAPYKNDDFKWKIPDFLKTTESKLGFIAGITDAEGCISKGVAIQIVIASKHKENLEQVQQLLKKLGFVFGKICIKKRSNCCYLNIYGLGNIKLFLEKIDLKLKKEKLIQAIKEKPNRRTKEEYLKVMKLRKENNWGGKKLSEKLNIPISTIEGWIYGRCKPWELTKGKYNTIESL